MANLFRGDKKIRVDEVRFERKSDRDEVNLRVELLYITGRKGFRATGVRSRFSSPIRSSTPTSRRL